jgi:hypothetical protein
MRLLLACALLLGCTEADPSAPTGRLPGTTSTSASIASEASTVVPYPGIPRLDTSANYSVAVNGSRVPVSLYNGHSLAWFAFSGTVNVVVTVKEKVVSYTLSPKRRPVNATADANRISFALTEPRQLILRDVNALREDLFLFADALERDPPRPGTQGVVDVADRGADATGRGSSVAAFQRAVDEVGAAGGVVYVPAGQYRIEGEVLLKSRVSLYLAPGAFVAIAPGARFAHVTAFPAFDAHDVSIRGRGVFYGDSAHQHALQWTAIAINVDRYAVEDVMFLDPSTTPLRLADVRDATITNVKIVAGSANLSDGVDIEASQHVTIDRAFIYASDDHVALGAGSDLRSTRKVVERITIKNSLFDHNGHLLSIVPFKGVPFIRDVVVESCDYVRGTEILSIYPFGGTNVSSVRYRNLRFEETSRKYLDIFAGDCTSWGPQNCGTPAGVVGYVHDIALENVEVDGTPTYGAIFNAPLKSTWDVSGVVFDNVLLGGRPVKDRETAHLQCYGYVSNIAFKHRP